MDLVGANSKIKKKDIKYIYEYIQVSHRLIEESDTWERAWAICKQTNLLDNHLCFSNQFDIFQNNCKESKEL